MKHPSEQDLALFAGGDLGWLERLRMRRHIKSCQLCRKEVAGFEDASTELAREAAETPAGWDRLSDEMTANIRLGLAAGECVAPSPAPAPMFFAWQPAAVLGAAGVLLVSAWWLNVQPVRRQVASERARQVEAPVVATAPEGIEVKSKTATLTLLRRKASSPVLYVSSPGSLRERFVDEETGQVTINNVYSE